MLKLKTVHIDKLMLDPNNPRFVQDLNINEYIKDSDIEKRQDEVLSKFDEIGNKSDFFDISDLINSMRLIGFVPIDRVVVRSLKRSDKYLVIEGNRRISAAKRMYKINEKEKNPQNKLDNNILQSLNNIEVMILDTSDLSDEELQRRVAIILGLRHFGSLLKWGPLPKAFNIYCEYLNIEPKMDQFFWKLERAKDVASRLSIKYGEVRNNLKTYIAYRQLAVATNVKDKHFSLIEAAVTESKLTGTEYFKISNDTFLLDDESVTKINDICQFDTRDTLSTEKIIISEPKKMKQLGKLVDTSLTHEDTVVKDHSKGLLLQVEREDIDVDVAVDSLKVFIKSKEWAKSLIKLLDKQAEELDLDEYLAVGNDLLYKNDLKKTFEKLKRVLNI